MWATAGTEIDVPISYLVEDDFVLPTTATVVVRDLQGAVVMPATTLGTSSTSTVLTLPAEITTIPVGAQFSTLFVLVTFVSEGRVHQQTLTVQLVPFVPLTVGAADVREILGLPVTELPDSAIRIHPAYFRLQSRTSEFDVALRSGTNLALSANRAVALDAALELIPSLALRIAQKLKAEDQEFARFGTIDWNALEMSLEAELESIMGEIVNEDPIVSTVPHFVYSIPTDPITGG